MRSKESAGLRYFHEVARTGSVTRAGANLFVAASAVSRQIRLLEDELGVQLFTRGSRGMTLTTAGHQVFAFAADAEQRASDLRSELNSDRYAVRGHVNVATVEGLLMRYVPVAIERLARTHADIRLCIRADGSQDVGTAVAEGSAQLGFVFGHPARPDLIALKSLPLPLSVMVRPGCSLATRASCTLRDLEAHPVALPTPDFGIRQEVERACAESNTRLDVVYESNSLALLRAIAIRTGAAIFMTAADTAIELAEGSLVCVPLADRRLSSTSVTLVKGLAAFASPAAKIVCDALLAAMAD